VGRDLLSRQLASGTPLLAEVLAGVMMQVPGAFAASMGRPKILAPSYGCEKGCASPSLSNQLNCYLGPDLLSRTQHGVRAMAIASYADRIETIDASVIAPAMTTLTEFIERFGSSQLKIS
jgi:hypothetical protein